MILNTRWRLTSGCLRRLTTLGCGEFLGICQRLWKATRELCVHFYIIEASLICYCLGRTYERTSDAEKSLTGWTSICRKFHRHSWYSIDYAWIAYFLGTMACQNGFWEDSTAYNGDTLEGGETTVSWPWAVRRTAVKPEESTKRSRTFTTHQSKRAWNWGTKILKRVEQAKSKARLARFEETILTYDYQKRNETRNYFIHSCWSFELMRSSGF